MQPNYLQTIATIVIPLLGAFIINFLFRNFIRAPDNLRSTRTRTYLSVLKSLTSVIIYITAVYIILTQLEVNMTPFLASAGVVGVVIGFGLRSFIEDFFTGVLILTEDTIRIGDYVQIGNSEGVTESLGLRTVRIRDKNGAIHIFPNREVKHIINFSRRQARAIVDLPIKNNQSVEQAMKSLEKAMTTLRKHKYLGKLISDTSRIEGVEAINPGHTLLRVLILTRPGERWNAGRTYRRIVLEQLKKDGIELA